ncbi:MAG: 23S rRNA (adenine(2503)-C(2))-methyltransferase RlmN, partial [Clostridia bacterium]|nr:23S rRNA (adenine(2503)-C(2))-methyltransferase RlmN [Clostridia bacterium]
MKIDILSLSLSELTEKIIEIGEPKFRAKQIFDWLCKGAWDEEMKNIPKALRLKLNEHFFYPLPTIEKKLVSKIDGTQKYLFKL